MGFDKDEQYLDDFLYSRGKMEISTHKKPEVTIPKEENPRVKRIARRSRKAFDDEGNLLSPMKSVQVRDAIFEAILDRFYEEPSFIAYSEETRD